MSGAEHQAPATASGSVRAPARQRDMAGITPVGRLAGRLGPPRGPCAPLRTPVPLPILASIPARPSARVSCLSTAQAPSVQCPARFIADGGPPARGLVLRMGILGADQVKIVRNPKQRRDEIGHLERSAEFDDFFQIVVVRKREVKRSDCRRPRQHPDSQPRDDPEIRLGEQAVENRPEAILRHVPVDQVPMHDGTVASAQNLAVAEHHLHTTRKSKVIEVWTVPRSLVEGVADHPAFRRSGRGGNHPATAPPLQFLGHHAKTDARLDRRITEDIVDLKYPVHTPAAIDDDHAGRRRGPRSEAYIVACRHGKERRPALVCGAHDRLHFGRRPRKNDRDGTTIACGQSVFSVTDQRIFGDVDRGRAQIAFDPLQEPREVFAHGKFSLLLSLPDGGHAGRIPAFVR